MSGYASDLEVAMSLTRMHRTFFLRDDRISCVLETLYVNCQLTSSVGTEIFRGTNASREKNEGVFLRLIQGALFVSLESIPSIEPHASISTPHDLFCRKL